MTIAAGFWCDEGVLLVTDTLYTGAIRRYGQKTWLFMRGELHVAFAGAGRQSNLERLRYELEHNLTDAMGLDEAVEVVETALVEVEQLMPTPSEERTYVLVAVRTPMACQLFENGALTALSTVGHPAQATGTGVELALYFIEYLYPRPMPMKWARIVACHLIKHVKKLSPWCGGDTQLVEIRKDGACDVVLDQAIVAREEEYLGDLERAMQIVLPDGRASDKTLTGRLEILVQTIKDTAKLHVAETLYAPRREVLEAPPREP